MYAARPPVLHAAPKPLTAADWANIATYARAVQRQRARPGERQAAAAGLGMLGMPTLDWKQLGLGLIVGVGFGYVLFATK